MQLDSIMMNCDRYTESKISYRDPVNYFNSVLSSSVQSNEFKNVFDKITGGEIVQEITNNYNVSLNVGSIIDVNTLLDTYDIRCKNFVFISANTLSKMEENPALKKKVMSAIEEFCSSEAQAEINTLAPPVKSAGMIVYPDGDTLYWLEGYPNELDNTKNKKAIVSGGDTKKVHGSYNSITTKSPMQSDIEAAIQILGTACVRKDI